MELLIAIGIAALLALISIISLCVAVSAKKQLSKMDIAGEIAYSEEKIMKMIDEASKNNPSALNEISSNNRAITGIGIEKYDAFSGMTGSYSFSVALVNDRNDGVILTTLYGHDSCNTYLREIRNGVCDMKLSPEEVKALNKAHQSGKDIM